MTNSVAESIRSAIAAGESSGLRMTEINISDATALDLATELAEMQMTSKQSKADIYVSMKEGVARFMDLPIVVTLTGAPPQST